MISQRIIRIFLVVLFFFSSCVTTRKENEINSSNNNILIAWWNVENLFDTNDDETQDDDYTPSGKYKWTQERLDYKFNQLSTVIFDLAKSRRYTLPDIMGFCEVEHQHLLDTLFQKYLTSKDYEIAYFESKDPRGIDVGIAFNTKKLTLLETKKHKVNLGQGSTRDILEVKLIMNNHVLYVFGNHWSSRRGGEEASEPRRIIAAQTLRHRVDELLKQDALADIIILGDLNDEPSNNSVLNTLRAIGDSNAVISSTDGLLFDFMSGYNGIGTYFYQNHWERIDHAIVSKGLFDQQGFTLRSGSFSVFYKDYMFEKTKEGKPTEKPFRTYSGTRYLGGFADHFPILLEISVQQ